MNLKEVFFLSKEILMGVRCFIRVVDDVDTKNALDIFYLEINEVTSLD